MTWTSGGWREEIPENGGGCRRNRILPRFNQIIQSLLHVSERLLYLDLPSNLSSFRTALECHVGEREEQQQVQDTRYITETHSKA